MGTTTDPGTIFTFEPIPAVPAAPYVIEAPFDIKPETVPGYQLDAANSTFEPLQFAFDPDAPAIDFGSIGADGRFIGKMPGQDLKVHYKYTPDSSQHFKLHINYQLADGTPIMTPFDNSGYVAGARQLITPYNPTGYLCTDFVFNAGKTPQNMVTTVQGGPDPNNLLAGWNLIMPNQDVTLTYKYAGNPDSAQKITQKYTDITNDVSDPALQAIIAPIISGDTTPGASVEGDYAPKYGYTKASANIEYNYGDHPLQPDQIQPDLTFNADQTHWSGHMPPAAVTITYSHTRMPGKWVNITYKAGKHGSLNKDGKSADLKEVSGQPGVYQASVLKNDPSDPLNTPWNFGKIEANQLSPGAVSDDSALYLFTGWFVDRNNDEEHQESEPLLTGNQTETFDQDTILTAAFDEIKDAWINVSLAAEKGELGSYDPSITHVPKTTTWGSFKNTLSAVTLIPWGGYQFEGWYDGDHLMQDSDTLQAGHTYTAKFVPNPTPAPEFQYDYTVQYENADGSLIFKTDPVEKKHIEERLTKTKITVPGYEFDPDDSYTAPADYDFDHNPDTPADQIGTFTANGFTGKMPGGSLVVHFRYKVKPAPSPEQKQFTLTVKHQSLGGAELKPDSVAKLDAEEIFTENSLSIDHYTCVSYDKVTGWDANPDAGVQAVQTAPTGVGNPPTSFTWSGKMPNQDVTLIYKYKGNQDDPGSKFTITEEYWDTTDLDAKKLLSRDDTTYANIPVDQEVHGGYVKPFGYDPVGFEIKLDDTSVLTNLAFGTGDNDGQWNGNMPATNVTIIYNNTRHTEPTPDVPTSNWATLTYQIAMYKAGEGPGTITSSSPDVTQVTQDKKYTTQVLISDGTEAGDAAAWKWSDLRGKSLVPTAVPDPTYYQFGGWYIDNNNNGTVDTVDTGSGVDTFLGTADPAHPEEPNTGDGKFFNGPATVLASFTEIPTQWIDISFNTENGTLDPGNQNPETMHIQKDRLWGNIKNDLPNYQPWEHYAEKGWYAGDHEMQDGDALTDGQVYTHKFKPSDDPSQQFEFTYDYSSSSDPSVVFQTHMDPNHHSIETAVSAPAVTIPGYTWSRNESVIDPDSYTNPAGTVVSTGSFDDAGAFSGHMPGGPLAVHLKYTVDPSQTFALTVLHQSANGVTLAASETQTFAAGASFTTTPAADLSDYTCTNAAVTFGGTATDTESAVVGTPTTTGSWTSHMPNQNVTVVYTYTGNTANPHKITEQYVDTTNGVTDTALQNVKTEVSAPIVPDTVLPTKAYVPQYGYDKVGAEITYDPANPPGADIDFTDDTQNAWTGHMPAADVQIKYSLNRTPDKWATITYKVQGHGTLSGAGKSSDLHETADPSAPTAPNIFTASILKDDLDPAHTADAWNWGDVQAKQLAPSTTADSDLYDFAGWYRDSDGNGVIEGAELDPQNAVSNQVTFTGDTTLYAVFKESSGKWIDVSFAAEKGNMGPVDPLIKHIPEGTTWGQLKTRGQGLPSVTPWANYTTGDWYDKTGSDPGPIENSTPLNNGRTYTNISIPNPAATYDCKVIYTNADDTLTFGTVDLGQKQIEDVVNASKIDVPGYTWVKDASGAEPVDYTNPDAPADHPDAPGAHFTTGGFDDNGVFIGTMPGQPLTVHYRYEVNPSPSPQETYHLKVRYESVNGNTLAPPIDEDRLPESSIDVTPPQISNYDCIGVPDVDLIKGFTENGPVKAAGKPDATLPYAWHTKMPNQDVELVYRYQGQGGDQGPTFTITENYVEVSSSDPNTVISTISTKTSDPYSVDKEVNGRYEQPYGYDPVERGFSVSVDTPGITTNIDFGWQGDANKWHGAMPASNVTITYKNTRHTNPDPDVPDDPQDHWALLTYKAAKDDRNATHGSLSTNSPDLKPVTEGKEYKTRILVSDGTDAGNAAAWKWSDLKAKGLVPTATQDTYYQFDGWYIDNNDNGKVDYDKDTGIGVDTFSGMGESTDSSQANDTYFNKDAMHPLLASFTEIPEQWINIGFTAENASLSEGSQNPETLHIQADKTWGDIQTKLPSYTAWPSYADDGWWRKGADGAPDVKMTDPATLLAGGAVYIHKFKVSTDPAHTYTLTKKYTNMDGTITFLTDTSDTTGYHIMDPIEADKITVPGYVWNEAQSTADLPTYTYDPSVGAAPVGSFNADTGHFTGTMPGQNLTVTYRYDVAPKPVDPADYPFNLKIRYESRNGATLHDPVDRPMNANDPIDEAPETVDHYDCDGYQFVTGNTVLGNAQPIQAEPDANNGYAWNTVMPNQNVELIYLYKGKENDPNAKFTITEQYMDVTDPATPRLISRNAISDIPVDTVKEGVYTQPYGYDPAQRADGSGPDFTSVPADLTIRNSIAFGWNGDPNSWHGAMPATNVTITYNNIRHTDPQNPDDPQDHWKKMTYKRTAHGTLAKPASAEVTETTPGTEYTVPILVSDGTPTRSAGAYKWSDLTAKGLLPTATADEHYTFIGWYQDDGDGTFDKTQDTLIGKGDETDSQAVKDKIFTGPTTLFADFEETENAWMDISFATKNSDLAAPVDPTLTHIPVGTTWGNIKNGHMPWAPEAQGIPSFTAWTNYTVYGWCSGDTDHIMEDTDVLQAGTTYTAVSKPSADITFESKVQYENADGVVFKTEPSVWHHIEEDVPAQAMTVPGYEYVPGESFTTPAGYDFNHDSTISEDEKIGTFEADGSFLGRMPGEALTVHYRYKPSTQPSEQKYTLTVKYYSVNGTPLRPDLVKENLAAETPIEQYDGVSSPVIAHYTCTSFHQDAGWTANEADGIRAMQTVPQPAEQGTGFTWSGKMPNQNVTLTYIYTGNQDPDDPTANQFTITQKYMDVTDPAKPKEISALETQDTVNVDTPVHGGYEQPYGYDPVMKQDGSYDFTIVRDDETVPMNLTFGTGDQAGQWSGAMPAVNVTITYNNTRQVNPDNPDDPANKWVTVTYQKDGHGTIANPSAYPDITEVAPNQYTAQVLKNDGTHDGYTWKQMKDTYHLVPTAAPDNADDYQFAGWYIDDGDGVFDKTKDTPLETADPTDTELGDSYQFTGPATIFASFTETDNWTNITFKPEHGSLASSNTKPETLHVQKDKTWDAAEIQDELPSYAPWPSYSENDSYWYREGDPNPENPTHMGTGSPITPGAVYIHRFVPITDTTNPGDTTHAYTLTVVNASVDEDGNIIVRLQPDDDQGGKNKRIDDPIAAAPMANPPGYTLIGQSINPATYAFDGVTAEQLEPSHVSFDPTTRALTGKMPGCDLTVTYKYKATEETYKLNVQYRSADGDVLLDEEPVEYYKAQAPIMTTPKTITGYTCTSAEILQNTVTPGITTITETPSTSTEFRVLMPNQDITVIYRYTGSTAEADKKELTVKYVDADSADQPELSGGSSKKYSPDEAIDAGTFTAPAGYQSVPDRITITPADQKGITLTYDAGDPAKENGWTGFMGNKDVTITCYCKRIPPDPVHPGNNYWGDITYIQGKHGSLGTDASVSADVTAAEGGGYKASVLLEKAGTDAYTWQDIKDKKLVPKPTPAEYYKLEDPNNDWFVDTDGDGIRDAAAEPLIQNADTFSNPTKLTASFVEDSAQWITLTFTAENGTMKDSNLSVHIPKNRDTWKQVLDANDQIADPWPGYMLENWTDQNGTVMSDDTPVSVGGIYTAHFIPDPAQKKFFTVEYVSMKDDGTPDGVVSVVEPAETPDIGSEVQAAMKPMHGYIWQKGKSRIDPAEYKFDPAQAPSTTGDFDDGTGAFDGHMPGENLTVTYGYTRDASASYKLTIECVIAGTNTTIYQNSTVNIVPGAEQDIRAPKLDGYIFDGGHTQSDGHWIKDGRAETIGGEITTPVAGAPDDANQGSWKFNMPNQDVTVVYYYTVDTSKQYTITERYIDTGAPAEHQDISTVVSDPIMAGAQKSGSYPDLYGYKKAGAGADSDQLTNADIKMDGEPWLGAKIEVTDDGSGWIGSMPPRNVTITYKYTKVGPNPNPPTPVDPDDPNPPTPDYPWGDIYYLLDANSEGMGTLKKDGHSSEIKDYHRLTPWDTTKTEYGFSANILFDNPDAPADHNHPYTIGDLTTKDLLPTPVPLPEGKDYYKFIGWYVDANNNGIMDTDGAEKEHIIGDDDADKTFVLDSSIGQKTLRAKFDKNPLAWMEIKFNSQGTTTEGAAPTTLDIQRDKTWGDLMNAGLLPTYTRLANYVDVGWYDTTGGAYTKMEPGSGLVENHTYTYIYKQDPEVFGTKVQTPDVSAGLDGQGQGIITLYDTDKERSNYNYILTDTNGTIQDVFLRVSRSQRVEFGGLQPEGVYNVYEVSQTVALSNQNLIGGNIANLGPIGPEDDPDAKISMPATVLIPVVDENYQVYYSDVTGNDNSAKLVIQPADPGSEYAVLDANGPVIVQGSKDGGWLSLSGSAASIQVPGLVYGAEYTVVARPKGQTAITAEDQREHGSVITAVPVGALNLKTYTIKTTAGKIVTVGGTTVEGNDDYYAGPIKGQPVTLEADPSGENGEGAFSRWDVTIGASKDLKALDGSPADFTDPDMTFIMPAENLVLTPVYEAAANPETDRSAFVTDEVRGGNKNGIALDPRQIPDLRTELTEQKDLDLYNANKADVTYKVIYKKGGVKSNESTAIQGGSAGVFPQIHSGAYHAAWGLNVSVERYVNGRPATATPSDATPANAALAAPATASDAAGITGDPVQFDGSQPTFMTYIQLGKDDVDMLDYQLYQITPNAAANNGITAELVPLIPVEQVGQVVGDYDPVDYDVAEQSGGLFAFEATAGNRYVMVYSRAYHLYFTNELPLPPVKDDPDYYDFKVRQGEKPSDPVYEEELNGAPTLLEGDDRYYIINKATGAEYYFKDWSYDKNKTDNPRLFDRTRPIKDTTKLYAYYSDNEKEVAEARRQLQQTIKDAQKLSRDPFLKRQDSDKLKEDIDKALGVINMEDPHRALEDWLQQTRQWLLGRMKIYQDKVQATKDQYDEIQSHNSGGGSSGGGGGGSGIKSDPYDATPVRNYTVGSNGDWKLVSDVPGQPKQWAFVLHGGMMLRSTWAYLSYPDVTNAATGWYHFNGNAIMDTGWYTDEAGKWYYSYKEGEGPEGKMATGWHLDTADGNWYYLDPSSGAMVTGWRQIDGKWYYFEPIGMNTYDAATGQWTYGGAGNTAHSLGAMYKNETTPDGYPVDANGARIQ